ncbi:IclR family transcriptional regulator C-terminal domain-containing protein [Vibrio chagasii]|nr:IclR family transcriptional regulator C-terminal domain-containing protein [Vibrio chagasii]
MACSAAGKCYLAFSSDAVREAYWQRNVSTMKPLTENTILDKSQFSRCSRQDQSAQLLRSMI